MSVPVAHILFSTHGHCVSFLAVLIGVCYSVALIYSTLKVSSGLHCSDEKSAVLVFVLCNNVLPLLPLLPPLLRVFSCTYLNNLIIMFLGILFFRFLVLRVH